MKLLSIFISLLLLSGSCDRKEELQPYAVSGKVTDAFQHPLGGIAIYLNGTIATHTDKSGMWTLSDLTGTNTIVPQSTDLTFSPPSLQAHQTRADLDFVAARPPDENTERVSNWMSNQQLPNGLLESTENGNVVSLYDNALAAMVFMLTEQTERAERIFDFFNARIQSELQDSPGGFSQFRDANGHPGGHRWMGDNAWMLLALRNYQALTGRNRYDALANALQSWLVSLQDSDGGLFAGYGIDDSLLNFKVTEGMIDAYAAVEGYNSFHTSLLSYLKNHRWDAQDRNLMAWPENPPYRYALDTYTWGFCAFDNYPVATLYSADRFLTTQTATLTGSQVTGYDIDEDREVVFLEGTGQMAVAFMEAGLDSLANLCLKEMEKVMVQSSASINAYGFPYSSNPGSFYGSEPLWTGADTKIAISSCAWYLFAKYHFNPFAAGRKLNQPEADKFWRF